VLYRHIDAGVFKMKLISISLILMSFVFVQTARAETFKPERYEEAQAKDLETSPEKYKGKKIFVKTTFKNFLATFPNYLEKNGIKPEKYYCMIIYPWNVPVILRKKSDLGDTVSDIKPMSEIKVYGKIKKFTRSSKWKRHPKYYFAPDYIEVLKSGSENIKNKEKFLKKRLKNLRQMKNKQSY
jgi:hypothetical protein